MARKGIVTTATVDTRDFMKGVRSGIIEPLEDVETALEDVSREGKDTGREIDGAARDAGRGLSEMGDDAREAGRDTERAMGDAESALEDVGKEAKETGREIDTSLEGAEDSLKDVGRAAGDAEDDMEAAFRAAQTDTERLKDAHKDLSDTIRKEARKGFKRFEDEADKASRGGIDATQEFKDEATSNFSEIASSFTGDMDSAVDLVQGTLGGLAGSLGPAGILAGAGAAVAGAFYTVWSENAEKTKERIQDMYDDMVESGESYLSESYQQEQYWSILKDESEVLSLKKTKEYAAAAGVAYTDIALAWSGNHEAMERVQERLYAEREDLVDQSKTWSAEEAEARSSEIDGLNNIIEKTQRRADEIQEVTDRVNSERTAWNLWGTETSAMLHENSQEMGEVQERIRGIGVETNRLPSEHKVKVSAEFDRSSLDRGLNNLPKSRSMTVFANVVGRTGQTIR